MFGSKGETNAEVAKKDETIHVFSLASGHLYERFLKIMMLSVTKHSSKPVKFWLLKNFLSPKFRVSFIEVFYVVRPGAYFLFRNTCLRWLRPTTSVLS